MPFMTGNPLYSFISLVIEDNDIKYLIVINASRIDYDMYPKFVKLIYISSIAVLIFVLFFGEGKEETGANSWIRLGAISIQPSEFVKLAFAITFSFIFIEYEWKYRLMKFPMIVTAILYILSVIYTVKGYKIAKEKIKNMVMLHVIFPSATIVGLVICLAILYIFWNAFSGFGSAEVTFWQWIF